MINLVTSSSCGICKYVKLTLNSKGKEYTVYDVSSPEALEIANKSGMKSLPIIEVDGSFFCGKDALVYVKEMI